MDLKAVGYLVSSVSVLLLGAVAWPKPGDPAWHQFALLAGMAASIVGMAIRFLSHRQEKAAIAYAKREAEKGN